MDLFEVLEDLERQSEQKTRENIIRAPFPYPGSKSKSVEKILPILPYRTKYIEPCGGSASVLLGRSPSNIEVFNDRFAGVTCFYRVLRSEKSTTKLIERLELTIHSREEFLWCRDTWCKDDLSDVERAARWFYLVSYSFGALGRNFGRRTSKSSLAGKIKNKLPLFPIIHERFKNVQVENQDAIQCMQDYDGEDAVFYLDPPYVDAHRGTYKYEMSIDEHRELIAQIFRTRGFVAVSGYDNPLYSNNDWDDVFEWPCNISISPKAFTNTNHKEHLEFTDKKIKVTEKLWIKESL